MLGQLVNWDYQWGQLVGRAWADDDFKHRLLADPARALAEYDLAPPAGVRIKVLDNPAWVPESTAELMYLVLPVKPSEEELSEDDLRRIAAAGCRCGGCRGCRDLV